MKFILFLFVSFLPLFAGVLEEIDFLVKNEMLPGGAVAIMKEGKTLMANTYGRRCMEKNLPVTSHTKFRISSNGKAFTAAAIMLLQERGKFSKGYDTALGVILSKHYPEIMGSNLETVTLRQLLNMTSGLYDYDDTVKTIDDLGVFKQLLPLGPRYPSNKYYDYTNANYALLKVVIDELYPGGFEGILRDEMAKPLHLQDTVIYNLGPKEKQLTGLSNWAYGYYQDSPFSKWYLNEDTNRVIGDGSVWSSIDDMQKWEKVWLYPKEAGGILSAASLKEAYHPVVLPEWEPEVPGEVSSYGFAWEVHPNKTIEHMGITPGFRSHVLRSFKKESPIYTIILLANHGGVKGKKYLPDLAEEILKRLEQ